MSTPTIAQLTQAISIAEQIAKLEAELARIVGGTSVVASAPAARSTSPKTKRGGKRKMSPETIAKMKAAQQARWAAKKGTILQVLAPLDTPSKAPKSSLPKPVKKKRILSAEGRARIVAALKARHAAAKTKSAAAEKSAKK